MGFVVGSDHFAAGMIQIPHCQRRTAAIVARLLSLKRPFPRLGAIDRALRTQIGPAGIAMLAEQIGVHTGSGKNQIGFRIICRPIADRYGIRDSF